MSSSRSIQATKNYRLFNTKTPDNRPLNVKKHKKLLESMKLYGFLRCFPIVVVRNVEGLLTVKDGQHRLAFAELLGLTVYWIEEAVNFDAAITSSAGKGWDLRDFALKHAANGHRAYQEGLDFADQHKLPVGTAFALMAGTTNFGNCQPQFLDGSFRVKDRDWAQAVAGIYGPMVMMAPALKTARFIEGCMAVCRVAGFDAKRLLVNAERCREKLVAYSTKDAFLDMLEEVYNFGRKQLVGLKVAAMMAMRERNVAGTRRKNGEPKSDAA